jgi:hypothetical protein
MSETLGITKPWAGQFILNAATPGTLKTAKNSSSTVFVTKVTLSITTHAGSAQAVTVAASAGTPGNIAVHTDLPAAAGVPSVVFWEFGKEGVKLTTGANLTAVTTASGPSGIVFAEGYEVIPPSSL